MKIFGILEKQSGGYGMNNTVLVTGGTGFIGSHVVELLLNEGYEVVLLKRSNSEMWRINEFKHRISCYDIDKIEMNEIFQKESINTIIHLATYYKKFHTLEDVDPMITSNINFPVKLLEMAREFDIKSFVNTGTFFEYAYNTLPIVENFNEKPFNFYATTKIAFENILKYYCNEYGINAVTLKLFSPYGPYDNEEKIIPLLINHAINGEDIILSHGLQKLDFVYVKDIADAYLKSVEKISQITDYEAINIGTGFPYSIRDVVSILEDIMGRPINKIWGDPGENMDVIFPDIKKAQSVLDWEPKYSLKRGLEETLEYYSDKNDI